MYQPFPANIKVSTSKFANDREDSLGLFARTDIDEMQLLGITHIEHSAVIKVNSKDIPKHGINASAVINGEVFLSFESSVIRTALGAFLNIAPFGSKYKANCSIIRMDKLYCLRTTEKISKNNELLIAELPEFPS